jgi:hypothetical protein
MVMKSLPLFIFAVLCLACVAACVDEREVKDNDKDVDFGTGGTTPEEKWRQAQDAYDEMLNTYVDPSGLVDYSGLLNDRDGLDQFIEAVGGLEYDQYRFASDIDDAERLALWINAYNAFTLQLILEHYPVGSIQDISDDPWKDFIFNVGGKGVGLDEIENSIIRPEFDEPRIHFAVNCAAVSCPALRNRIFPDEGLKEALEEAAVRFANDSDLHVRIDRDAQTVKINVLLDWYKADFGGLDGVRDFVADRVEDEDDAEFLRSFSSDQIEFISYNWSLNQQ